jgi:hypothetical protein
MITNKKAIQENLYKICRRVYGFHNIGVDFIIYRIDFSSIKLIEMVSEIYRVFGIKITLQDAKKYKTVGLLVDFLYKNLKIQNTEANLSNTNLIEIEISSIQKGMIVSNILNSKYLPYNLFFAYKITGDFDIYQAKNSFECIIKKYEAIRSVYYFKNNHYIQKIKSFELEKCPVYVIQKIDNKYLNQILNRELQYKFKLDEEIPIRVFILQLRKNSFYLIINIHHICIDLESISILLNDFKKYYFILQSGQDKKDLIENIDIKKIINYSLIKKKQIQSGRLDQQKNFWNKVYERSFKKTYIIGDLKKYEQFSGEISNFLLKKDLFNFNYISINQQNLCSRVYASIVLLVHFFTKSNDIIIIVPVLDRIYENHVKTFGLYLNMLPTRNSLFQNITIIEAIENIIINYNECIENLEYPFNLIDKDVNQSKEFFTLPFSEVTFSFIDQERNYYLFKMNDKMDIKLVKTNDITSKNALFFIFYEVDDQLNLRIEYNNTKYSKNFIDKMSKKYIKLLKLMCSNGNTETLLKDIMKAI